METDCNGQQGYYGPIAEFQVEYVENVLKNIFAVESYDKKSGKILYDESIYDEKNSKWVREPNKNQKIIPSYRSMAVLYTSI